MKQIKKTITILAKSSLIACAALTCSSMNAQDAFASTDFTGRTVDGATANNITWEVTGIVPPSPSLTAVSTITNAGDGSLFVNPAGSPRLFGVANNVGNGGAWSVEFEITTLGEDIELGSLELDWSMLTNGGALQAGARDVTYTVDVSDDQGASILPEEVTIVVEGIEGTAFFLTEATLTANTTFTFSIAAAQGTIQGVNAGIGGITLRTAEPSILSGDELLATEFTFRRVNGSTATIADYVLNGVSDPGDLTAVTPAVSPTTVEGIFDTASSAGFFAVDTVANATHWEVIVPLSPSGPSITLGNILLEMQNFNAAGVLKTTVVNNPNSHYVTVELLNASGEVLAGQQIESPEEAIDRLVWTGTFTAASGIELASGVSYSLRILISGEDPETAAVAGNFVGLNNLRVLGESSSLSTLELEISQSNGALDFSWNSTPGLQYDLRSATSLEGDPATWPIFNDGTTLFENIAASGSGVTSLSNVALVDEVRFFVVTEEAP